MAHKKTRLNGFELLPDAARPLVKETLEGVLTRLRPQSVAYEQLVFRLHEIGITDIPNFTSFNRLVQRERKAKGAVPAGSFVLSSSTRTLLAAALRSLADDLDGVSE